MLLSTDKQTNFTISSQNCDNISFQDFFVKITRINFSMGWFV